MDENYAGELHHSQGTLQTPDGMNLYEQSWSPSANQKAVILIIHGIQEYSGRYADKAERFVKKGFVVESFDLRGHGHSDGVRNYVKRFRNYLDDVETKLNKIEERYPGKPLFVLGHSMGGLITLYYYLLKGPDWHGALFSAPAVKISDDISPFLVKISSIVSAIFPKLPTVQLSSNAVSRDPEVVQAYENDPLVYHGKTLARTGAEVVQATKFVRERLEQVHLPLLIMHGTGDQLTDPDASRELYDRAGSEDKTIKMYEGLYHEIMNEPEKEQVFDDIFEWIVPRASSRN